MEVTPAHIVHLVVSAVLFLSAWRFIGIGLMKPFFDLLIERDERTAGDEKRAKEAIERSARVEDDIQAELNEARIEGMQLKEAQAEKAREEAGGILGEARTTAESKLGAAREEIAELLVEAAKGLEAEATELSSVIVSKVKEPGRQGATRH